MIAETPLLRDPRRETKNGSASIPSVSRNAQSAFPDRGTDGLASPRSGRRSFRDQGLFPSEAEIARRLSQTPQEWAAKAIILERDRLPRIDPIMGGRFWPAVEEWWRRRYGLSSIEVVQPDGGENLDAL